MSTKARKTKEKRDKSSNYLKSIRDNNITLMFQSDRLAVPTIVLIRFKELSQIGSEAISLFYAIEPNWLTIFIYKVYL